MAIQMKAIDKYFPVVFFKVIRSFFIFKKKKPFRERLVLLYSIAV